MSAKPGFTLIELLILISLTMILASFSMPVYSNMQASTALRDAKEQITQLIRIAKNNSCTGKNNLDHGVYFQENPQDKDKIILFSGSSYQDRISELDQEFILEKTVDIINTFNNDQLVFTKNTCMPDQSGILNIYSETLSRSINISINPLGIVSD